MIWIILIVIVRLMKSQMHRYWVNSFVLVLFFGTMSIGFWPGDAGADSPPRARVVGIVDGDTIVLGQPVEGAKEVRLVGIQAPKLPLGRRGFKTWPLADIARDALAVLLHRQDVTLQFTGPHMDRHRRLLAHVYRSDGLWAQGEMLRSGLARVYTFADHRGLATEMYALEREARAAGRGIWAHPYYAIRQAAAIDREDIGTFQLIEGTVVDVSRVKKWIYINFGEDWRSDFTINVAAKLEPAFRDAGIDLMRLPGRHIRVRGWLNTYNGPTIEATHPEQLEILDE